MIAIISSIVVEVCNNSRHSESSLAHNSILANTLMLWELCLTYYILKTIAKSSDLWVFFFWFGLLFPGAAPYDGGKVIAGVVFVIS